MNVDLTREDIKSLVKGTSPYYNVFSHPLVMKAGHIFSDQNSSTSWSGLDALTDLELMQLYKICKESWN